jgi:hypothetical protein
MSDKLQDALNNLEDGQMIIIKNGRVLQVYVACPDCGIRACYNWSEDQVEMFRAVYQDLAGDF